MYPLSIFASAVLLTSGFILSRKFFYQVAEDTLALLNSLLDTDADDSEKQRLLTKSLGRLLASLAQLVFSLILVIGLTALPVLIYLNFDTSGFQSLDFGSWQFYLALVGGSLIPFILFSFKKQKGDYSEMSILLHRIALNHYNIAKSLFSLEQAFYKAKTRELKQNFIIVSGLARAGTTGLTTLLCRSGKFHSLAYSNMPFLLTPNIWKIIYNPKKAGVKERAHGDKVMFGYNTVEALEEFFFKVFLKDSFIKDRSLTEHGIDPETYNRYIVYQNLLKPNANAESIYLAKNNNLILRYHSLRKLNPDFKIILLFRDPLNHAYSLLKQHVRFSKYQKQDKFIAEYMNWLGHHEFGLNLKHFEFSVNAISNTFTPESINYWLCIWINYYSVITRVTEDKNLFLVDYIDFLRAPHQLISALASKINVSIDIDAIETFENTNSYDGQADASLMEKANDIHKILVERKLVV